jgi:hypothetical protein
MSIGLSGKKAPEEGLRQVVCMMGRQNASSPHSLELLSKKIFSLTPSEVFGGLT